MSKPICSRDCISLPEEIKFSAVLLAYVCVDTGLLVVGSKGPTVCRMQASVTVTPLSLRDWLFRPVPTPMDPSLTLYGAAVHNAHVACCEVCIGGLLSAIEDGAMERPAGLPCGKLLPLL